MLAATMPLTLDAVHAAAMKLPDVAVATKWGNRTWVVNDKGFAWERPLRKTDLERLGDATPPTNPILAVRTADLDAKDALLAMDLPGFFTIQHFNNYAAVLIELRKARAADVRMVMEEAHRVVAAKTKKPKRKATGGERGRRPSRRSTSHASRPRTR